MQESVNKIDSCWEDGTRLPNMTSSCGKGPFLTWKACNTQSLGLPQASGLRLQRIFVWVYLMGARVDLTLTMPKGCLVRWKLGKKKSTKFCGHESERAWRTDKPTPRKPFKSWEDEGLVLTSIMSCTGQSKASDTPLLLRTKLFECPSRKHVGLFITWFRSGSKDYGVVATINLKLHFFELCGSETYTIPTASIL